MDSFTTQVLLLSAGSVLVVHEILKLKVVPIAFANRFPVVTNILLSIIAAIVASLTTSVQPQDWQQWIVFTGTISVVAAITYNQLIGKSAELKSIEGPGK